MKYKCPKCKRKWTRMYKNDMRKSDYFVSSPGLPDDYDPEKRNIPIYMRMSRIFNMG